MHTAPFQVLHLGNLGFTILSKLERTNQAVCCFYLAIVLFETVAVHIKQSVMLAMLKHPID